VSFCQSLKKIKPRSAGSARSFDGLKFSKTLYSKGLKHGNAERMIVSGGANKIKHNGNCNKHRKRQIATGNIQ
jgi:hypothetical protein